MVSATRHPCLLIVQRLSTTVKLVHLPHGVLDFRGFPTLRESTARRARQQAAKLLRSFSSRS